MTKPSRKLDLKRETIQPLQGNALDDVHGGISPAVSASVRVSIRFCAQASRAISAASVPVLHGLEKARDWVTGKKK